MLYKHWGPKNTKQFVLFEQEEGLIEEVMDS